MMEPFYASPAANARYQDELYSWIGTPFRFGPVSIKGPHGGVDCIGLCIAVHVACGACKPVSCARLPLDWHLHHDTSAIMEFLTQPDIRGRLFSVPPDEPLLNGDLVAIQTGKCIHHLGLIISDGMGSHLVHCPIDATVQRWPLTSSPLDGRIRSVWRIMKEPAQ